MRTTTAFLLMSAALPTSSSAAPVPSPPPATTRLYKIRCASCHGNDGEGGVGVSFKGKLQRSSPHAIEAVIKHGIPGTAMPAAGLPDPAVKNLAAYVLYLNKRK